jgi:hypothetical protein
MSVLLPAVTALLALVFAVALLDQWRERRRGFQLIWGIGMVFFAIAAASEALGAASGWNDLLYRTWYLTGAVFTAAWLGLGTAFLLNRTRFGYTYGALVIFGGLLAFVARGRYADAGDAALLIMIGAVIAGLAITFETYFQNDRWPMIAGFVVAVGSLIAAAAAFSLPLIGGGFSLDPATGVPTGEAIPGAERLLSLVMNFSGGLALVLGALFSSYIFMPKRRLLDYSLDPGQPFDHFLFNLIIAVVAIPVNFIVSLPGAIVALLRGRIHSRVPATLLIAIGGLVASSTDALSRLGSTDLFQAGKFVGVVLIFAGFLISIEAFAEIRVPFTGRVLRGRRHERGEIAAEPAA